MIDESGNLDGKLWNTQQLEKRGDNIKVCF
jgi:hypothetical protein